MVNNDSGTKWDRSSLIPLGNSGKARANPNRRILNYFWEKKKKKELLEIFTNVEVF